MSFIPRLHHDEYQSRLSWLRKEMGGEWVEDQLIKLGITEEPSCDEDRWTVWNALNKEVGLAFQERKLKKETK